MNTPAPETAIDTAELNRHFLRFTGRGAEYFRVWLVNVLLSILTLGLYTPWARRRTVRYFYAHTQVAGSPLEFTGSLRKMVTGFGLFVLLYIAFEIARNSGQTRMVALFILLGSALAPYLWASAMRFRLGNTRWRGLHLHLHVNWREVYLASWPVFITALVWVWATFALHKLSRPLADAPSNALPFTRGMVGVLLFCALVSLLLLVRLQFNYKSLLVRRTGLGQQFGRWKPVYTDFLKIWGASIGVAIACLLAAFVLLLLVAGGSFALLMSPNPGLLSVLALGLGLILLAVIATMPARAYWQARMFRLQWSRVGLSQIARFKCSLKASAFVRLRMRNAVLTLLTLGLYRPFALIQEYQLKVHSVSVYVKGGLDQLVDELVHQQQGGLGDVLADAAGLDFIG